jgi:hypothetical protein
VSSRGVPPQGVDDVKKLFSFINARPGLQESRRAVSTQEDVERYSCDACPGGVSSPPGWLAHPPY